MSSQYFRMSPFSNTLLGLAYRSDAAQFEGAVAALTTYSRALTGAHATLGSSAARAARAIGASLLELIAAEAPPPCPLLTAAADILDLHLTGGAACGFPPPPPPVGGGFNATWARSRCEGVLSHIYQPFNARRAPPAAV